MAAVSAHSGVVKGKVATPGSALPPAVPARVITTAMQQHYRDKVRDSVVSYSPAWTEAKVAIRHLNFISPLVLAEIQRTTGPVDMEARKASLSYLTSATSALAKTVSEAIAPNQELKVFDQIELTGNVSHIVARLWSDLRHDDSDKKIEEFLGTVTALYRDKNFAATESERASLMMNAAGYLKVDSPETMETRLRQSVYLSTLKFFEAVTDSRLESESRPGMFFSYGQPAAKVVKAMRDAFDGAMADIIGRHQFQDVLSNDQRTSIMQAWLRNAGEVFGREYVARTASLMKWFQAASGDEFKARFAQAKQKLPTVLEEVTTATVQTMAEIIAVAEGRYAEEQQEKAENRMK